MLALAVLAVVVLIMDDLLTAALELLVKALLVVQKLELLHIQQVAVAVLALLGAHRPYTQEMVELDRLLLSQVHKCFMLAAVAVVILVLVAHPEVLLLLAALMEALIIYPPKTHLLIQVAVVVGALMTRMRVLPYQVLLVALASSSSATHLI
jgi:hypothetical protein